MRDQTVGLDYRRFPIEERSDCWTGLQKISHRGEIRLLDWTTEDFP
jgi:hypothetical protein